MKNLNFGNFDIDDLCFTNTPSGKILAVSYLLGISISTEKCSYDTSKLGYLGVNIDLCTGQFIMRSDKALKLRADISSILSLNESSEHFMIQFYLDRVSGKLGFYGLFFERSTSRSLASVSAKFRLGKISKVDALNSITAHSNDLKIWDKMLLEPERMIFDFRSPGLVERCMPCPTRLTECFVILVVNLYNFFV